MRQSKDTNTLLALAVHGDNGARRQLAQAIIMGSAELSKITKRP